MKIDLKKRTDTNSIQTRDLFVQFLFIGFQPSVSQQRQEEVLRVQGYYIFWEGKLDPQYKPQGHNVIVEHKSDTRLTKFIQVRSSMTGKCATSWKKNPKPPERSKRCFTIQYNGWLKGNIYK